MSEIIHTSSRGTVEAFEEKGEKRIRRTVNAELPLYETLKNSVCEYLPRIYSVDIGDGKTVVTEEFISGKNLSSVNLDEKQVVDIMVQLCASLEFIHGLGIVHRDIKPSNVLLSEDGSIRLIDFEAARFVRDDKDKDTRYLGTDGFAPPEQYGFSQTDFRTDIYAAGQTMKTLLGSLSAKRKYAKIIRKCTAFDPAERYQSARELSSALTGNRGKISAAAVLAAAAVLIFALVVPKDVPAEDTSDEAVVADVKTAVSETTTVSTTEFTAETTTAPQTETAAETEIASETETENNSETTVPTETEATSGTPITAETNLFTEQIIVSQQETTAKTETSSETTTAVTTSVYEISIPNNLPTLISPEEYALLSKKQQYYTKVNIQPPAYVYIGNEKNGFKIDNGSYVLKNTSVWVAMYRNDYVDNDILVNGEIVNAASSAGSIDFGIKYMIGTDENVLNITSRPTISRKSTVILEDNGIELTYYVNGRTIGGYIKNGDTVRFDTPIMIGCYKNLVAGYDITVNGKVFPVKINGDNTYMLGLYMPDSKETVIGKTKRNTLTEYEKTNYVPVYFSGGARVFEFPFSDGSRNGEWCITYNSGDIIEKGSKLRIAADPSVYEGKVLKINGNTFVMTINGDGSSYLFNYTIPKDIDSLNITLETKAV